MRVEVETASRGDCRRGLSGASKVRAVDTVQCEWRRRAATTAAWVWPISCSGGSADSGVPATMSAEQPWRISSTLQLSPSRTLRSVGWPVAVLVEASRIVDDRSRGPRREDETDHDQADADPAEHSDRLVQHDRSKYGRGAVPYNAYARAKVNTPR